MQKLFLILTIAAVVQLSLFTDPLRGATLSGNISLEGTHPMPPRVPMHSDPTCKLKNPNGMPLEEVIVDSEGNLKNVFVYIKEGLEGQSFEVPKEPVVLDQKNCRYAPHVFGVQAGQSIEIRNSDNTLHNVRTIATTNKRFNLGMPIQGMKINKRFESSEIMVQFKCDVHPWMAAYAGVLDHPFFTVTDDAGNFEIQNVPEGTYLIEAWHEKFGSQTQKVTISSDNQPYFEFKFAATS